MTFLFVPAFWALVVAAVLGMALSAYAWTQRQQPAARWAIATALALVVWFVGYAVELIHPGLDGKLLWANLQFVGIGAVPVFWLNTVRALVGKKTLRPGAVVILFVVPVITVVLAFTGGSHEVFRGSPELVTESGMLLLHADYGWWHNGIFVPFQYLLYLLSLSVMLSEWTRSSRVNSGRYAALVAAMLLPMAGGALYVVGIPPFEDFNPTSILLLVSLALFAWVITRHRALDLVPIARERVVDTLSEAIIVVDRGGRIVDTNPAASRLFPELDSAHGQLFSQAMADYPSLGLFALGLAQESAGFEVERSGESLYCMAQASEVLAIDGTMIGTCISVTDISAQVRLIQSDTEEESNSGRVQKPRAFTEGARMELSRALSLGTGFAVVVVSGAIKNPEYLVGALESELRDYETASQLGDERFAIAISGADHGQVQTRVETIMKTCGQFMDTVSSGVATADEGNQIEVLLRNAIGRSTA